MQSLIDFLSFKLFISPYVLIICYYIGAVGIPIGSWFLASWARNKFSPASDAFEPTKQAITPAVKPRSRILLASLFMAFFVSIEIIWRMLFEFLIAYLQMREALMGLVH